MLARALRRGFALATGRLPVLGIRDFQAAAGRPRAGARPRLRSPWSASRSRSWTRRTGSTADLSYVLAAQIAPSLDFHCCSAALSPTGSRPQQVIIAANLMMAIGEGTFGILVLTSHPAAVADDRAGEP